MNIMELGAIGELVGGVAVIATLLYLAAQVRQSTRALTSSAELAGADAASEAYNAMAQNSDLAELLLKGATGYEALSATEKFRFGCHWQGAVLAHQHYFFLNERRVLSPEVWGSYSRQFDALARMPGVVAWWGQAKTVFDSRFARYFEAKLLAEVNE